MVLGAASLWFSRVRFFAWFFAFTHRAGPAVHSNGDEHPHKWVDSREIWMRIRRSIAASSLR